MKVRGALALIQRWHDSARYADWSSERVLEQYVSAREESAFCELMHRHAGHVWAVCRRELSRSDLAEDAFQATFLALVRKGIDIRQPGALVAWLDRTARRAAGTIRKKESRRAAVEAAAPAKDGGEAVTQPREMSEAVRAAVAELPDRYRLPITYRYLVGLPPAEVAQAIGVPENTGKTRLKRGLQLLRDKLGGKGLGIGVGATTGGVSMETALTAAAERVPDTLLVATLAAVRALPVKRGLLAAVLGVTTYRRVVVGGFTLAGGMAVALAILPAYQPCLVKVSLNTTPERDPSMRGSPLFALAAALGVTPAAPAQTFTKIADTGTMFPSGSGNITGFVDTSYALVSGSTVCFSATGPAGERGVFTAPSQGGAFTTIANLTNAIPGGNGNFMNLNGRPSLSGSTVLFSGGGSNNQAGIYSRPISGGTISLIADTNTPIPNGVGAFTGFTINGNRGQYLVGSNCVFLAAGTNDQGGVYSTVLGTGAITRVADANTPAPNGTGPMGSNYGYPVVSGTNVLFSAGTVANGKFGIYKGSIAGGPIAKLYDLQTPIANGTGTLLGGFTFISISGSNITFAGVTSSSPLRTGIYAGSTDGGPMYRIADYDTSIPAGSGNFTSLNRSAVSGSTVLFAGGGNGGQSGIYKSDITGGLISKVVANGDILEGKTVLSVDLGNQGFDNSILAFSVTFTDGSSGVYTFTPVPEPTGMLALSAAAAAGCFALGRWLFGGL